MKSTDSNYPTKLFIPQPFASGTGAALTAIEEATGTNMNFVDGFPSAYGCPASGNGKFVTRGEMNAIGNLASKNEFYRNCGGINTFDATLCAKIGGYPLGAVLDYLVDGSCFRVISLAEDNTYDFTKNGVDGTTYWAYCATVKEAMTPNWSLKYSTSLLTISSGESTLDTWVNKVSGTFASNGYVKFMPHAYTVQGSGYSIDIVIGGISGEKDVSNLNPDDVNDGDDAFVSMLTAGADATNTIIPVTKGCQYSLWVKQVTGTSYVSGSYSIRLFPCA